jgi:hypothetical protein
MIVTLLLAVACGPRSQQPDAGLFSSDDAGSHPHFDAGPPAEQDAGPNDGGPTFAITSIAPPFGQAGDLFTLNGVGFAPEAQVFFGTVPATGVSITPDGAQATGTVPAQAPRTPTTVSVSVQNAPGISTILSDAFTYGSGLEVSWCQIEAPTSIEITVGDSTPTLQAQVYQANVTPGGGHANGLTGQLGFGLQSQDVTSWTFVDATYASDTGNNDVFTGSLMPSSTGSYRFAFRFSLDSGASYVYCDTNGMTPTFEASAAGMLTVDPVAPLSVTGVSPTFLPVGGGTLMIAGTGFNNTTSVTIGGMAATITAMTPTLLTVTAPAVSAAGPQPVVVSQGTTMVTAPAMLDFVLKFTITVDGYLNDWPSAALLGTDTATSSWGSADVLTQLYMGYDDTNFYIGIAGSAEAQNAIVGYLSISGLAWGSNNIGTLMDHSTSGDLDDELSSVFSVADTTFLAHYGFGLFGMAPDVSNGLAAGIGARQLMNASDLAWATATVARTSGAVEFAIPWQTNGMGADLFVPFPSGSANPMTIRSFVRLVACDGGCFATQGLPDDPNLQPSVTSMTTQEIVSRVAAIEIR